MPAALEAVACPKATKIRIARADNGLGRKRRTTGLLRSLNRNKFLDDRTPIWHQAGTVEQLRFGGGGAPRYCRKTSSPERLQGIKVMPLPVPK
jgi:hypothetical protein